MPEIADITPSPRADSDVLLVRRGTDPYTLEGVPFEAPALYRLGSDRTLTSSTSMQSLLGVGLTLPTGLYRWELLAHLTGMSSTSGNGAINLLGSGTATMAGVLGLMAGRDAASTSTGTLTGVPVTAPGSVSPPLTAGAATEMWFESHGFFRITAGGTIIPSITLLTAAAALVKTGSYMRVDRIGDHDMVSQGAWA